MVERLIWWPMRPLVRRLVDDLGDFAGVTWRHLAYAAAAANVAIGVVRGPWYSAVVGGVVVGFVVVEVVMTPEPDVVEGPEWSTSAGFWGILSGINFWVAVSFLPTGNWGPVAGNFTWALLIGLIAYGPGGGGRGTPFVVRAWRAAKAATRATRPAGAGA